MKRQCVRRLALSYLAVIMTLSLAALNSMMLLVGYWLSVLVVLEQLDEQPYDDWL
ncbi:hypothetical protein V4210_04120 [Candidatus Nanosynbacter sp. BB002]|uniref:hypothetical protein n=1 Tax=Candidatus Nanosynbacter sp. BB002 TaxID=3393757 RepID=UPI0030D208F0